MNTLSGLTGILMLLSVVLATAETTMSPLQEERYDVLVNIWAGRTNYGADHLRWVYDTYATNDTLPDGEPNPYEHRFGVDKTGDFSGKEECREYAVLGADPNYVELKSFADVTSIVWGEGADADLVYYYKITNYSLHQFPGNPQLDGFLNTMIAGFQPNTSLVSLDFAQQDPAIQRFLAAGQEATSPEDLCTLIMEVCTGPYQMYDSWAHCVVYAAAAANRTKVCPSGYIANDTACLTFHGQTAPGDTLHARDAGPR
jgi:hypothetical protein